MRMGSRSARARLFLWLAGAGLGAAVVSILAGVVLLALVAKDLPSPDRVVRREGFATRLYDREGQVLYDVFSEQKRTAVGLTEVPVYLRQATIAIEDKHFYRHQGFDPFGLLRAAVKTVVYRRLEGGSTLTQQLVKNTLLTPSRTLSRKIKEFVLTLQVESRYSKDEILQMYLNEAPYGGIAWGVQAGAETYFGKPVSQVSLPEAAVLAGLPQAPSRYSPFVGEAYVGRAKDVLRRMREDGYITAEEEQAAGREVETLETWDQSGVLKAPHFVFYVRQLLSDRYGEKVVEQGGLQVTTSLDLKLQEQAEKFVVEELARIKHLRVSNGAAVVMDAVTGEVLAMVGSRGWDDPEIDGKYNVALASRQPGSSIKPVTYLTGLRKGYTAATLLMDTRTVFPGGDKPEYVPENYDGKFRGPVRVREALGNSLNIPAVKMLSMSEISDMLTTAYELGFTTLEPTEALLKRVGLSVTLGGGEVRLLDMTAAYSAFANGGYRVDPVAILKVTDNTGKVLEEVGQRGRGKRVMSEGEAFIISSILSDPQARQITFGAAASLTVPGRQAAVKTGTTNDRRDNWTAGWTAGGRTVGVWVGNNDNSPMREVASGVTGASPIWKNIMMAAVAGQPTLEFVKPDEVVEMEVDAVSGYPAHDGYAARREFFIKGTEPAGEDPVHRKIKVCKGEGKLATPADVASGNYEEREAFYFKEEDPFQLQTGTNKWQEGILNWLKDQADPRYHPPTEFCGSTNPVWIVIRSPADKSRIDGDDVTAKVEVQGTNKVTQVEIYLDGELKYTLTEQPWEVTIPNVASGSHRIDVKARDEKGFDGSRYVEIGVNQDWTGATPSPVP